MVDTEQENTVASKSILKRRIKNERVAAAKEPAVVTSERDAANSCKRIVTFDETITVKNEKDLVIKRPLKLELVIDHWKSPGGYGNAKTADDEAVRHNSGIVKRLVDEFNAVQDKATELTNGRLTLLDRFKNSGRVNDLINMFNSKSTIGNKTEMPENKFIDF